MVDQKTAALLGSTLNAAIAAVVDEAKDYTDPIDRKAFVTAVADKLKLKEGAGFPLLLILNEADPQSTTQMLLDPESEVVQDLEGDEVKKLIELIRLVDPQALKGDGLTSSQRIKKALAAALGVEAGDHEKRIIESSAQVVLLDGDNEPVANPDDLDYLEIVTELKSGDWAVQVVGSGEVIRH